MTSPFKPTHMQLQAVDFLEKFMKSPEIACTLAGYAGTGKTTLLGYLNTRLHKEDKGISIAYCSFTGKASVVLKKKLQESTI